jgi:hypothetical protein
MLVFSFEVMTESEFYFQVLAAAWAGSFPRSEDRKIGLFLEVAAEGDRIFLWVLVDGDTLFSK